MSTGKKIKAKGPVRIDRIAETLLDPVVSRAGFSSTQILAAWSEIAGPDLAARSRPEKLRWPPRRDGEVGTGASASGATLVVRAEGGDAMELQYASAAIVARVNAIFGWRAVERLSIRQAPVDPGSRALQSDPAASAEPGADPEDAGLAKIEDPDLRAALSRLGTRIALDRDTKP